MIHIYHGEGKGKTTAAVGLAVRAAGSGFNVIIAQFLKARESGELNIFHKIDNITLLRADIDDAFSYKMTAAQRDRAYKEHNKLFDEAARLCAKENTLLVLDEIIGTIGEGLIDSERVLNYLKENRDKIEIALTGRSPSPETLALGDYITEMKNEKHPYDSGAKMRKGIEY